MRRSNDISTPDVPSTSFANTTDKGPGTKHRAAFTLVELMVAVSLVVVILVMFAQIFAMASNTVTTQKGIGRNDQRARMLIGVLKGDVGKLAGDLGNRTFRDVIPYPQDTITNPNPNFDSNKAARRRGYFYIAENDPDDDTDDVIALTIEIPQDGSQHKYAGRASLLKDPMSMAGDDDYLWSNPNQPEFDDGQVQNSGGSLTGLLNAAGESRTAEVVYFLRNGVLYRKLLLVREPYDDEGKAAEPAQPDEVTGDYDSGAGKIAPNATGSFWNNFDYSAFYFGGLKFHHFSNSLKNENPTTDTVTASATTLPRSLGVPYLRFGHSLSRHPNNPHPREHLDESATAHSGFFGRFLLQETAHTDFGYPGRIPVFTLPGAMGDTPNDPHTRTDSDMVLDSDGVVQAFNASTSRRGEEILLTNVHSFDIKVWDDGLGTPQFADLGHSINAAGYYHSSKGLNPAYSSSNVGYRYDTWHPGIGSVGTGRAPFRPLLNGKTQTDPTLGTDDEVPLRAIQITIRYLDVSSNKMRQVTIVHSLVNDDK